MKDEGVLIPVNLGCSTLQDYMWFGPDISESIWSRYSDTMEEYFFWDECYYNMYVKDLDKLSDEEREKLFDNYMMYKECFADLDNLWRSLCIYLAFKKLHPDIRYKKQKEEYVKLLNDNTVLKTLKFLEDVYRNPSNDIRSVVEELQIKNME